MSTTLNLNHFDQGERWALGIRGFTFHPMFFDRNYTGFLKPKENNPFSIPPLYKGVRTFDPSWLYGQVELTKGDRKRQYARVIHSKQNANSFKLKPDVDYHVGNQSAHLWENNQDEWIPKDFTVSWWHSPLGDGPFYMGYQGVDRGYFGIPTVDYQGTDIPYYEHSFFPIYFSNNIPLYDQSNPYGQAFRYGTYIYVNGKAYEFEPPEIRNESGTFDGTDFYPNCDLGLTCTHTVVVKGVHVISRSKALVVVNVLSFIQYARFNSEGYHHPLEDYMDFWNRLYVLEIDLRTKSPQGNLTTQYVKKAGSNDKWIKNYDARLKVTNVNLTGLEEGDTYEDNLWGQWPARFNRSGTEFSMIWSHITHDFQLIEAYLTDVTTHEVLVTTWRVVENNGIYTIEDKSEDSYKYAENQITNSYEKIEIRDEGEYHGLLSVTTAGSSSIATDNSKDRLPIALNYDVDTLKVAFIHTELQKENNYSSSWTYNSRSGRDLSDFSSVENTESSRFFIKIDNSEFSLMLGNGSYTQTGNEQRIVEALGDDEYHTPHKTDIGSTNGNVVLDLIYINVIDKIIAKAGIVNDTISYFSDIYQEFNSYPLIYTFFDTTWSLKKGYGFVNEGFDNANTITTTNFDTETHSNTPDYHYVGQLYPIESFSSANYIAATEDTIPIWFYGRFAITHFVYSAQIDRRLNPNRWMYSCVLTASSNIANGLPSDMFAPDIEWFNSSIPGVKTAVTTEYATENYPNIIIGQIGLI